MILSCELCGRTSKSLMHGACDYEQEGKLDSSQERHDG